jgi:hypothetical protein
MIQNLFDWLWSAPVVANILIAAQAIASIVLAILTGWTLYILRQYAADTKSLAQSGNAQLDLARRQLEASETPVIVIRPKFGSVDGSIYPVAAWLVENQGSGLAFDVIGAITDDMGNVMPDFSRAVMRKDAPEEYWATLQIQSAFFSYRSLSGTFYETDIDVSRNPVFIFRKAQQHKACKDTGSSGGEMRRR